MVTLLQFIVYNDLLFPGKQAAYLADRCHIYLLPNGRINIGSLNRNNLDRFAQAVHEAITNVPDQEPNAQMNNA
jgi:aspartate/tyrosine/aromatic aminotransferase